MNKLSKKIRMPRLHEFDSNSQRLIKDLSNNGSLCIESLNHSSCKETEIGQQCSSETVKNGFQTICPTTEAIDNNEKLSSKEDLKNSVPNISSVVVDCTDSNYSTTDYVANNFLVRDFSNNKNKHDIPVHVNAALSDIYCDQKLIGSGKFGKVYKVTHRQTLSLAAAKEIQFRSTKAKEGILYEIDILKQLGGSDYIVKLFEVIECYSTKPHRIIIITEYLDGGDLFSQIAKVDILTEEQVIQIMIQILEGVSFIHNHQIIHRDLKPENIIYQSTSNDRIKIIDFGFAVRYDKNHPPKSMVGTTLFVAPEVLRFENQSLQTDIWSIGVIAYDLLAGITPFEIPRSGDLERELTDEEIMINIERCQYDFDDDGFIGVSDQAKSFISSILIIEPEKRMTVEQCLQHPWLHSFDRVDSASEHRSVSVQRMKNYLALKKWEVRNQVERIL